MRNKTKHNITVALFCVLCVMGFICVALAAISQPIVMLIIIICLSGICLIDKSNNSDNINDGDNE